MAETGTDLLKLSEIVNTSPPAGEKSRPDTPKPAATADDGFDTLKALTQIGSILPALAFVIGQTYMTSYYTAFGFNPLELDFSIATTAAFAVHVLRPSNVGWPLALASVLLVGLVTYNAVMVRGTKRAWAVAAVAGIGILLFVVAAAGSATGRSLAQQDAFETSPRLPTVGFVAKSNANPDAPSCLRDGTIDCKLLLHAKGEYYFFEPIHGAPSDSIAGPRNLNVYVISESEVSAVHVSPGCGAVDGTGSAGGC